MDDDNCQSMNARAAGIARFGAAEWQARCDLAAAFRLAHLMRWTDMLATHFSLRVPGTEGEFLINPFGLLFEEITASNLIRIDAKGNKLTDSSYVVNRAGFVIHSALHMGRADAHCVLHCHTRDGVAVSMQAHGLLMAAQRPLTLAPILRYHDYEGIAVELGERERLVADMGLDGGAMILRNHGTLTIGATIAEAFNRMYRLENACSTQIAALSGGAALYPIAKSITVKALAQAEKVAAMATVNDLVWAAMLRKLAREGVEYAV